MRFIPKIVTGTLFVTAMAVSTSVSSAQAAPASASSAMPQFTILIFESPAQLASRNGPAQDAYWTAYDEFAAALMQGGVLRGGSALSEAPTAIARGAGSTDAAVRGARLGGYFVIAATNLEEAERWARLAPKNALTIEVRPHRNNPHMAKTPPQ